MSGASTKIIGMILMVETMDRLRRYSVTQPLGLLQTVGRQEDRHALIPESTNELVHLAAGNGVRAGRSARQGTRSRGR